jgi:phage protein D
MSEAHNLTMEIKFDGSTSISGDAGGKDTKDGSYIRRFQVDRKVGVPDYFLVQLQMSEFTDIILLDKIKPGAAVELKVGYATEGTLFKGEVSYIEPHFAAGDMYVDVSGFDTSHRLTRGTSSGSFGNGHDVDQNFGDVLSSIVGESKGGKGNKSDGLSASAQSTSSKASYIARINMSAYDIIRQIAGSFGLDWNSKSSEGGSIALKPAEKGSSKLTIWIDKGDPSSEVQAITADFRCSTVKQVSKVVVRGYDSNAKKAIKGEAESVSLVIGGTPGYEQAGKAHLGASSAGRIYEVVDVPVGSIDEAKEVAESVMAKLSMDWQSGTVVIEGRPDLSPGDLVTLRDFGTRYSGDWLIDGLQHVFIAASGTMYRTYLNLVRNGSPEP